MTRIAGLPNFQQWLRTPSMASLAGGAVKQDYAPTDEEEKGLREQGLLGTTMGGLQAIGSTFDLPGSWVRGKIHGAITGDWSKGPQGITDPAGRVYGSDILSDIGVPEAPENWTGGGTGNPFDDPGGTLANSLLKVGRGLAGFGVDVATDPLSLIGIGGKTAQGLGKIAEAGRAAEAASAAARAGNTGEALAAAMHTTPAGEFAGKLAPQASTLGTIGNEIRAGDRAALNINLPWWIPGTRGAAPLLSIGSGSGVLGSLAGKAADTLAYNPAMRLARGPLSPAVHGMFDIEKQKEMDQLYVRLQNEVGDAGEASRIFRESYDDLAGKVQDIATHHIQNADPKFADELLRGLQTDSKLHEAEAAIQPAYLENYVKDKFLAAGGTDPTAAIHALTDRMIDYHVNLKGMQDWAYDVWGKAGGHAPELQDLHAAHAFRSSSLARGETEAADNAKRFGYKAGEFDARPEIARNDATRNHPGSEPAINAKGKDPLFMGYDTSGTEPVKMDAANAKAAWEGALGLPPGTQYTPEQLRRMYSWEKHDKANIESAFSAQKDASGAMRPATDTIRDAQTGKILKDPATGEYQPWVRHINDGTPEEMAADYYDEMKRWDPANPVNVAMGSDQPIDKLAHFLDGFKDAKQLLANGVYDQDIARDSTNYVGSLLSRAATLRQAQNWLSRDGVTGAAGTIKNGVKLPDAWDASGLNQEGMKAFVQNHAQFGPEMRQAMTDAMNTAHTTNPQASAAVLKEAADDAAKSYMESLHVQPAAVKGMQAFADLAEAANRTGKPGPLLQKLDNFNKLWKTLQYNIWPPSHIRDIASRVTNSALDGRASTLDIVGHTYDGVKYLINKGKAGYKDPERMAEWIDSKIYKPYMALDTGGAAPARSPTMPWYKRLQKVPGAWGTSEADVEAGNLNPLVNLGYSAQGWGDFAGQYGHFAALRDAGYTVEQARQIIRETHYTNELSPFEKSFLSRVVPFERFTVRNIPHQLASVFSEPGGRTAQMVRGLTEKSSEANKDTYVPEWMRENVVYPAGRNAKGEQGYYHNTLAPQHELSDIAVGHGLLGDVFRTGEKLAAKASPLALLPFEQPWSDEGRQLETGRKISDLESPASKIASALSGHPVDMRWLDSLLHYSPAARLSTQLIEPAAAAATDMTTGSHVGHGTLGQFLTNMLGLGKVSYYDDARWKALDARHALEEQAQAGGAKPWTNFELPKYTQANMKPEDIAAIYALLRRRQGLTEWLKEHAQQRQQQQQQPATSGATL